MFRTILIANRGEIACRIIATCRRLGVKSVAVFSDADRDAPFVQLADRAMPLGRSEPRESYLDAARILDAAVESGAEGIHPGYGFLAENADFAEACAARGIEFIGPPPSAIRAMGLKDAAKELMEDAGVRVVPGHRGEQDVETLRRAADRIGYPVLIKAVAGGGGKGMRRVDDSNDFLRQLEAAQREAKAAFGDVRVLLERYLEKPRHIEVQVFGDRQGNVVHLFERDCSLQRRHQKIIEEAPAFGASEAFRATIYDLAVRAARAVNYEGAGTVELIADVSRGLREDAVYFMEMNTRLQVEHPVTEQITGFDLVEWQLRVASGEPLPVAQEHIVRRGHAIEARLYAEDPERDYMPQSGKITRLVLPAQSEHTRVDAGYVEGDTLSVYYDALLAKLIVWDQDRDAAVRRLQDALRKVEVASLVTNVAQLRAVAEHRAYRQGDLHTGFLLEHAAGLETRTHLVEEQLWTLACIGRLEARRQRAQTSSPWSSTRAFRLHGSHRDELSFSHEGVKLTIGVVFERDGATVLQLPSREVRVTHERLEGQVLRLERDRAELRGVYVEREGRCFAFSDGFALDVPFWPSPLESEDEGALSNVVKAPMPGKIQAIFVQPGDRVERGRPLLSLEAMKMEHTLRAPRDGTVGEIHAKLGEQVGEAQTLLVLADVEASGSTARVPTQE